MTFVEQILGSFLRAHDAIYQRTNGRVGQHIPGFAPALLLHTVGAKTEQPRTTSLSYATDGNNYLVVASKGGAPKAPGWYFNLKKQPHVEINVGPRRLPVAATIVVPGDADYERLWNIVNANNRNVYRGYQERTTRPIPVVVLSP